MKLAILGTRGIPARYGGFETFAERLAEGLALHGFDVTVFCEAGNAQKLDVFRGARLRHVFVPPLGPLKTIFYDAVSLWMARKDYDVVYMLGYGAAPFCLIPRLYGAEVWLNPDGLEWARSKWPRMAKTYFRLMEWIALRAANRIIADADSIAESLEIRHRKLTSCTVIPYGCEVVENPPSAEPLSRWGLEAGRYYLVVCRLEPENHVLEILHGLQQSGSAMSLIVVGDHRAKTGYVDRLLSVRDERIRMIGTVYDRALLSSLRYHAFAYLHGHSVGGTNPSLLEAMGCGNLIFAHDNVFNRETLGTCGFYFKDAAELARAMDRAEQEGEALADLREAALERARLRYRWPNVVSSYAALLNRVAVAESEPAI